MFKVYSLAFLVKNFCPIAVKMAIAFLFLLFSFAAFSQKQANILSWKTDVSLNTYLLQQMNQQYDARRIEFNKAIQTKATTLAYLKSIKSRFQTVLGSLPEKSSLDPKITGTIIKSGYRIEKIVYQSFTNHHVTANLYIPAGKGKFPSVLFLCGHEDLAKATVSYQQTAILFAQNGFVVLVIDPISQGERVQLTAQNGKPLTRGSTTEHTLLNLSSNLLGTSVAAYELFDNVRGLDYLVSRPEVDADQIGAIGNSGGAMQAIYLAAIDERLKIIAPCSYLASREKTFELTGAADGCAQIPGEGAAQLEMSDYLIAAAPKPILILAGRYDFIDYNSTLESLNDLKKVYQILNTPNRVSLFSYDDGHGISKPKREMAVQWFRKWFYKDDLPIKEGKQELLSDTALFASARQNVNLTYRDELTIATKNQQLFEEKAGLRKTFAQQTIAQRKQKIKELLGIKTNSAPLEIELSDKVITTNGQIELQTAILRKKGEMPLPMYVHQPKNQPKKVIICIGENNRDSLRSKLINEYSDAYLIFADLRGTGETTDKLTLNDPKYFSKDYRTAMLALHIGKPLVGQRTTDILNLIDFIQLDPKLKNLPITINSTGLIGIAALHAAFLNEKISSINLSEPITSYREMLAQPLAKDRYGAVIPNVLSYYDLPDLINWIGAEKISFH